MILSCKQLTQLEYQSHLAGEPNKQQFPEGALLVDGGADPCYDFFYKLAFVDPFSIDYSEKHTAEEHVLAMPSTQQYIKWYKQGHCPPPLTAVFHQTERVYKCQNRRRLLAARAAGVERVPVFLEAGRFRDLFNLKSRIK